MHVPTMPVWKKMAFLLLFVLGCLTGKAQIYPVEASTLITPPYSVYLPDYASPGGEKLRIVLLQRDLTVQGYRLRFEMRIQVNGVTVMQTSRSAMPPPITLQPGIPTVLGGSDLSWYVQPQNVEFGGGFTSAAYEQNRCLPEGPISITFTAYDYTRNDIQVSQPATAFFYATRDNPPLLNYPACGMNIAPINPQFLNFSWLPQNTSSPNSALQTNYVFSLWAVLPAGYSYQDIVQSSQPIFTTTIQQPNFVYGPGQPMLTPGIQYAWRVQAVDATGRDLFENNGFSQTCYFNYTADSGQGVTSFADIDLHAASAGSAQGKVWWTGDNNSSLDTAGYTQYQLYYRKAQGNYDWESTIVADSQYRIFDLEPATTYECRLQGYKNGGYGPYTSVVNFTTDSLKSIACSAPTSMLNPSSGRPLSVATSGMNLTYGPWNVQLLSVTALGSAGQFKGTCKVTVPFMGGASFNAKFDNITVDDSRNVTAGTITFLSQGMQAFIDSSIANQMGGSMYGKVVGGSDTTNVTVPVSLAGLTHLDVTDSTDGSITSFFIPGAAITVQVNSDLQEVTIKDSTGSTYALDNKGNLTQLTYADPSLQNFFNDPANVASLDTLATGKGTVTFTDADAKFAFDAWKPFYAQASTILTSQYEKLSGGNGTYYVPQKAIGAGESDIVGLDIDLPDNMDEDSLVFTTAKGVHLIWDPNDHTLNLIGGPAADAQEVYALYPKPGGGYYSLAKLLVSAYEQQSFTAVLVPVGTSTTAAPQIDRQHYEDLLNGLYNGVNIYWKVILDSAYNNTSWDANNDGLLTMSGSGFLSNALKGEPAALASAYKKDRNADNNSRYIFFLNASGNTTGDEGDLLGDMPRAAQYGFVFLGAHNGQQDPATTLAHELGHGQFNLEHTFSGDIAMGSRGATATYPNLMDYVDGDDKHLYKYQWNQVHQPGEVLGIFESDTAGQEQLVRIQKLIQWIKDNNGKVASFNKDSFFISSSSRYKFTNTIALGGKNVDLYSDVNGKGNLDLTYDASGNYNYVSVGIRMPAFSWLDKSLTFGNDEAIPFGDAFSTLFYVGFFYNNDPNNAAIQFYTHSYDDYSTLLTSLGLSLDKLKPRIISFYQEALKEAGDDCDKLDVIYESMPDFVMATIDDSTKWSVLTSLSKCTINETGTNENLAVLNIVNHFDPVWFYNQATQSPQLLIDIINKLSTSDYVQKYSLAIAKLCGPNWTQVDVDSCPFITLTEVDQHDNLANPNAITSRLVGCFTHEDGTDAYKFGNQAQIMDFTGTMVSESGPCIDGNKVVSALKPVEVSINDSKLLLPAFCTYYLCADIAKSNKEAFFSFAVSFLMPNMINAKYAVHVPPDPAVAEAAMLEELLQTIKNNLIKRIAAEEPGLFEMRFNDDDKLRTMITAGINAGISEQDIEDIIFNACRVKKEDFEVVDIVAQMNYWAVIKARGYPGLFQSMADYQTFSKVVKDLAQEWGVPSDQIYVQGSSLRIQNTADIKDLDIAIKVDETTFNQLVDRFKKVGTSVRAQKAIGRNGKIPGTEMHQGPAGTPTFTGEFYSNFAKAFNQEFPEKMGGKTPQLSIIKVGGKLDVGPFMSLK